MYKTIERVNVRFTENAYCLYIAGITNRVADIKAAGKWRSCHAKDMYGRLVCDVEMS